MVILNVVPLSAWQIIIIIYFLKRDSYKIACSAALYNDIWDHNDICIKTPTVNKEVKTSEQKALKRLKVKEFEEHINDWNT